MRQWVVQEILAAESDEADWDMWIIGTVDGDAFEERARTFDRDFAYWMLGAFRWFEQFEDGVVKVPVVPKPKSRAKRRSAA